jgi:hypothetical protein
VTCSRTYLLIIDTGGKKKQKMCIERQGGKEKKSHKKQE